MDEKHGRGSMREDQERERGRQETPGRSPQSPGSRGGESRRGSDRPGGGSSSQTPGGGSQKGSRGNPRSEEREESEQ